MYGVQGSTWVALGDPVGSCAGRTALIRQFLERCDDFDGVPVFYEVAREDLHRYADFGLTFVKLGEEARVDLNRFTLDGSDGARYRKTIRRLERDGGAFRIIEPPQTIDTLRQLREVSDDWLRATRGSREGLLARVLRRGLHGTFPDRGHRVRRTSIRAFANVWPAGAEGGSLRRSHALPSRCAEERHGGAVLTLDGVGQDRRVRNGSCWGWRRSRDSSRSPVATLWNRLGSFLYHHGEFVYKFQGLRAFKEKFDPVWEPRYLAYPGGMRLPKILADLAALVAGGYRRILLP